MIYKKTLKVLILLILIKMPGAADASATSHEIETEARNAIKKCNDNLKSSTLRCTAGCGLAYKACLDEGGIIVSKEVERIYKSLIVQPDCRVFAEKLKGQVDGFIIDTESEWQEWAYSSEFSFISYLYLYNSLLLLQKKCKHE